MTLHADTSLNLYRPGDVSRTFLSRSFSLYLNYSYTGDRFITPVLQKLTPDDYDKWVPVVVSWTCKSMAMSIAWKVQSVITGVSSSLKGGLVMATATCLACQYRGITLFGLMATDTEKSSVDETLSYTFAAAGDIGSSYMISGASQYHLQGP